MLRLLQKVVTCRRSLRGAEGLIQPRLRTLPMPLGPLGRTASSEGFQDGGSLTRKMSERASKLRATRDRSAAIATIAAGAQKDTYTFSTTLHGCLATPSCGLAVNADNVITAVLQDSPATARMHVHALGPNTSLLAVRTPTAHGSSGMGRARTTPGPAERCGVPHWSLPLGGTLAQGPAGPCAVPH